MVRLIVLVGQPASGKSTIAADLADRLRARGLDPVHIVDEPSLHLLRNEAYASKQGTRTGIGMHVVDRGHSGQTLSSTRSFNVRFALQWVAPMAYLAAMGGT
jgi:molybdopterin-guanine dinucleotide biosynthesis protein